MKPPTNDAVAARPSRKVWHAGTLTYTATGLAVLFCWLLWGDFAWSMKERSVTSVAQLMLRQLNASDMMVGLLIGSLPSVVTMFLGPVISYLSDRHRGPRGRRIPYLMVTTPIAALSMGGLAFTPVLGRALHQMLGESSPGAYPVTMLVFAVFWGVFEIATVAANVVFSGLINDVVPQVFLGRFYGLFRTLSLVAGMVFSFFILGRAETHFDWIFIGVGLFYGVGFWMMCIKVKEGEYPPAPAPAALVGADADAATRADAGNPADNPAGSITASSAGDSAGVAESGGVASHVSFSRRFAAAAKTYFRECFSRSYYVWVFAAISIATLSFNPVNLFSVFFAQSVGMSMDLFGKYISLTFLISLVLSYPLGWFSDRVHPLRSSICMLALYVLVALWGGIFARDADTFAIAFVLHCVLSGCFFTCSASLGQRLFPRSRFAQFFSAAAGLTAMGTMLLGPLLGKALDVTGHLYRHTFTLSCILAALGLVALLVVHRRWMKLGGARDYVAPE